MGGASPLSPYPELLDFCRDRGWRSYLDWGADGWVLDIRENGALIARSVSTEAAPRCFMQLAARAAASLGRAGKARP